MSGSTRIDSTRWQMYLLKRKEGLSKNAAGKAAGISWATIQRVDGPNGKESPAYRRAKEIHDELYPKEVVTNDHLPPEVRAAVDDFAVFRLRYFGRYSTPWQTHAAEQMRLLLESDEKEYVVINVPPGAGKSTLFTHDILVWLIVRNRTIRIMIGSATENLAKKYGGRILRTLERPSPLKNDSSLVERGLVADAEACLVEDFGRFKPAKRDRWRQEEFIVEQSGDVDIDQRDATVTTYGRDGGFLGGRFDLVIWDDLVTNRVLRTAESREALVEWWDGEAESRLEPGGVMILQGQRLLATDLYRYALDKTEPVLDGDDIDEDAVGAKLYKHIIYKAHHDEVCNGDHGRAAKPYDPTNPTGGGCLLDPHRLSWRELQRKKANNSDRYLVMYQQEDVDPAEVLVNRLWVSGGTDPATKEEFLGVWDDDRSCGKIPKGLTKPWTLVVSADPSPAKFWSVQNWLFHPGTEQRILIDHYRGKLTAPEFLGWDINDGVWTGILEHWWQDMNRQGEPFRWVVVEQAAAQRFLLQYDHVKKWMAARSVQIIAHDTHGFNKNSDEFGVQMLAPHWRFGRVRLPGNRMDGSRGRSMALVDEVTRYPDANTTDAVMAEWFAENQFMKRIRAAESRSPVPPSRPVPSWLRRKSA